MTISYLTWMHRLKISTNIAIREKLIAQCEDFIGAQARQQIEINGALDSDALMLRLPEIFCELTLPPRHSRKVYQLRHSQCRQSPSNGLLNVR